MPNKNALKPGESLRAGGPGLISENGDKQFRLLADGNLYAEPVGRSAKESDQYWQSHTGKEGGVLATMQPDGNFVLRDAKGKVLWETKTSGHPNSYLRLDNDVTVNVYGAGAGPNGGARWWVSHHLQHEDIGDLLNDAVQASGKAMGGIIKAVGDVGSSAIHKVSDAASSVGDALASVPVVGGLLHGLWNGLTGTLQLADAIAQGQRIDRALYDHLKREISVVSEVGPWVETVIAFVPGIGPVASAAIACGIALAEGKPIDQAMVAALAAAIPGGALAKSAYGTAREFITTGKITAEALVNTLVSALPLKIPDQAKAALAVGVSATERLAKGERLDQVLLDNAIRYGRALLGPEADKIVKQAQGLLGSAADQLLAQTKLADALTTISKVAPNLPKLSGDALQKGLTIGFAIGQAQNVQAQLRKNIQGGPLGGLVTAAQKGDGGPAPQGLLTGITAAARANQSGANKQGFDVGTALMKQKVNPFTVQTVRGALPPGAKAGFDSALALGVGRVAFGLPNAATSKVASVHAAYLTTLGTINAPPEARVKLAQPFLKTAEGRLGVTGAVQTMSQEGWFTRLLKLLGFR